MAETEASMIERLHARYSAQIINGSYRQPRYARATHVASTAGAGSVPKRIADYISTDCLMPPESTRTATERSRHWTELNGSIYGHEVKVSRSDWLSELADPTKAEEWARYCHHWYLVAPEGIVRDDLPDGWGLMVPRGNSLVIAVKAPRRDPLPMPPNMTASLARAIAKTESGLSARVAAARALRDFGRQVYSIDPIGGHLLVDQVWEAAEDAAARVERGEA